MQRRHSQPQKQKKSLIGCENWKNSSQSAAGGRKRYFSIFFLLSFFSEAQENQQMVNR